MSELLLVLTTFAQPEEAQTIVRQLVEERLIACGNLLPEVTSIYRWQGEIETAGEVIALLKTTRSHYPALEARLRSLHPYEVPEIVAIPAERGLRAYLDWVNRETS